jgi:predicted neuraminidase
MFFETKNPISSQGDIAAAVSKDAGTTWQQLGVVLDEEWHLSYPYVFSHGNEVNILFTYWRKLCIVYHQQRNSCSDDFPIYLFSFLSLTSTDLHDA